MDYLDPRKQYRHRIILLVGYACIAIAIALGTRLLVEEAYGFGLKNGVVIQNGLIFLSSQPNPATITIDGKLNKAKTNARLYLPAGIYRVVLSRAGYRSWQRTIELDGGSVEHFDYPFLIPNTLTTQRLQTYASAPGLMTQSPDRRWLLVQAIGAATLSFDLRDLTNPTKAPTELVLPVGLASKATTSGEQWQMVDWADDNTHFLLRHSYDGKTEFILFDRANPAQSINLNTTLTSNPSKLTFSNKKYDQYYLYDSTTQSLATASLSAPAAVPVQQSVLAYQTYGSNSLLYVTAAGAPTGKVQVNLAIGGQIYPVRSLPVGSNYLLDLTKYGNRLYLAVGSTADNRVYIYKDPVGQLSVQPGHAIVPAQVLHVATPNYVSFSTNAQFIMAENGNQFAVYDIENLHTYLYTSPLPMDAPQTHASWMDGDRLDFVSGGKLTIFDYDGTNRQILVNAGSAWQPAFAPDYKFVYELVPNRTVSEALNLDQTALLTQ